MKTKIYNNLIFSLLFVCSLCGLFGGVSFAQAEPKPPSFISAREKQGSPGTYKYVVDTQVPSLPRHIYQDSSIYTYYWGYGFVAGAEVEDVTCENGGISVPRGAGAYKVGTTKIVEEDNNPNFYREILFPAFNSTAATIEITPTSDLFAPYSIGKPDEKTHTLCVFVGYEGAGESKNIKFIRRNITEDIHNGLATNAQSTNGGNDSGDDDEEDDEDDDDNDDSGDDDGDNGGSDDDDVETAPITTTKSIRKGDPAVLHLYSGIWGKETIETTSTNQGAVSGLIQKFFKRFLSIIFTVSGILMVIMLAVHGTQMIYAEFTGNVPGFSDAKKRVKAAAIGTIILLLSWIILDFIDPSLLRPKLFTTITQLREVGQGGNLISFDLTIPDAKNNVKYDYDKETGLGTVTIKVCPEIQKGSNFDLQVESISDSLRGKRQYSYQILYSSFGDKEVKVYEEGREDRTFNKLRALPGGGNNFVGIVPCNNLTIEAEGIPNVDSIVVFPIVSILAEKEESVPNTNPPEKRTVKVLKKFWRGKPWRHKPDIDIGDIVERIFAIDHDAIGIVHENVRYPTNEQQTLYTTYCDFKYDGNDAQECKNNEGKSRIIITVSSTAGDRDWNEEDFGEIKRIYYKVEKGARICEVVHTPATTNRHGGIISARWVEWCDREYLEAGKQALVKVDIGKTFTITPTIVLDKGDKKAEAICFKVEGNTGTKEITGVEEC